MRIKLILPVPAGIGKRSVRAPGGLIPRPRAPQDLTPRMSLHTRQQVINRVHELMDLTFLDDTLIQAPAVYGTAVSTTCNLKCPFCMRESLGIRENKHMDFDAFAEHIDQLRAARRVSLFGLGEPFLHPRFFDFVALLKEAQVYVATSTHGMSLTPDVRERLVEIGLDELNISIDATTKDLFERLRKGAIFETVVEQVTALSELKRARNAPLPVLNVNMTVHAHNVDQVPDMVRLAHRMGCQSVSYSSAVVYKPEDEAINVLDTPVFERRLEQARLLALKLGLSMLFWRQKSVGYRPEVHQSGTAYGCGQLNSTIIVERNGRIKTCCYIEEYQGDAFADGPAAAFNSEGMRRERRNLIAGRVRTECQGCVFLRERTPYWIQAHLNEAARLVNGDDRLTDDDRTTLRLLIERYERRKQELYPDHRARTRTATPASAGSDEYQPVY